MRSATRARWWGALVVVAGCGGEPTTTGGGAGPEPSNEPPPVMIDLARLGPACFSGGEAAELDLDSPEPNWTWNDPSVLVVGDEYWMYASATDNFEFPVRLYRLTSKDGVHWTLASTTPILDVGPAGSWDAGGVETPAVVEFNGQYHLFYTGYPVPPSDPNHAVTDYRVGHAVSDDGLSFTRADENPIVAPGGADFRAYVVGEPGPVVHSGQLELYFTAVGNDPDLGVLQVVGVTTSADGATFSEPERALAPNQALYPRADDWVGYSTPFAVELAGEVHLFYDVAQQPPNGAWRQLAVHHARKSGSGWVEDEAPIRRANDLPWAVDEIRSPAALLDGTSLRLWVAGHDFTSAAAPQFGVGELDCDLAAE
ncbi:MAG: hypothetical protein U0271_04645 [Polyangiaceae bacterium]